MQQRRAFTLIELMVVVALISIVAAILIPSFLQARKQAIARAAQVASNPAGTPVATPSPPPAGPQAELRAAQLSIRLSARTERSGMEVATPFQAQVDGTMTFGPPRDAPGAVRLCLPFPRGASDATNVKVKLTVGQTAIPQEQIHFDKDGLSWTGILAPDQEVMADLHFLASGQDQFWLPLSQASHLRSLKIVMDRRDCPQIRVPAAALQPSHTTVDSLVWEYSDLVSDRPLIVDLPTDSTVDAKVLLLCRLVGLAVLLYGLGFWYLGELHQPGRLSRFNWGNFMLLSMTYSFFFPALAILSLGMGMDLAPSLGLAAALSLPLLTLHVTRIVDFRFALSNLWLALLTLGIVVNGVFGGAYRLPVYLACSFFAIGFVTLTYRRWSEHRQDWHRSCEVELLNSLQSRSDSVRAARDLAQEALAAVGPPAEREALDKARASLLERLRGGDELLSEVVSLTELPWGGERRSRYALLKQRAESHQRYLTQAAQALRLALDRLHEAVPRRTHSEGQVHCLDCGQSAPPSRCCPHCGSPRPLRLQCGCGHCLTWPANHLKNKDFKPHCLGCGSALTVT